MGEDLTWAERLIFSLASKSDIHCASQEYHPGVWKLCGMEHSFTYEGAWEMGLEPHGEKTPGAR